MSLEWENLGVSSTDRPLLHSITGHANEGEMLAILGPTGSGKTTLLDCLAHRLNGQLKYSGQVRYSGKRWNKNMKRCVGFIEQDDIVIADLTVRQSLRFLAELRLPNEEFDLKSKLQRVESVISQLRLSKAADTRVGQIGARGISGGERKRMCIAQEMLVEPNFILADEPTSGLDSTMASITAKCLQELARPSAKDRPNKTVIVTIHQPSSSVFQLFERVILLDEGKIVYQGKTSLCMKYFSSFGLQCPSNYNPADYLMDIVVLNKLDDDVIQSKLSTDFEKSEEIVSKTEKNVSKLLNNNGTSGSQNKSESKEMLITVEQIRVGQLEIDQTKETDTVFSSPFKRRRRYANSWLCQVEILMRRQRTTNSLTSIFTGPNIIIVA